MKTEGKTDVVETRTKKLKPAAEQSVQAKLRDLNKSVDYLEPLKVEPEYVSKTEIAASTELEQQNAFTPQQLSAERAGPLKAEPAPGDYTDNRNVQPEYDAATNTHITSKTHPFDIQVVKSRLETYATRVRFSGLSVEN